METQELMLNKHRERYLLIIISIIGLFACVNTDRRRALFDAQLDVFKENDIYHDVQTTTNKNLKKWLSEDLKDIQVLKKSNWKLDEAVFFNSRKDKCYLLLLVQDKDTLAKLDYVYLMYGALEQEKWNIYFTGLPTLAFPRDKYSKNEHEPIAMPTLSLLSREEILQDYYKANRRINDEYVNKAYTLDLKKKQATFLKKSTPSINHKE
ncbi:hypothetical protein AY601_0686 [Pedobacter cryoconitis]|uniref:Uncharacterized protein n=1 Tax=Pedobacter cryoconitis TaxID=188932 RepID=A0A127V8I7_9SPHI|nr:hypothetical protein [Pedobacter cryoconitis]AMP97633.1 hypothetical protein AY601_0686 [Pedobacter cryoconitis]